MAEALQMTLRSKLGRSRQEENGSSGLSPVKALRLAFEKAADKECSLALDVRAITQKPINHEDLQEMLPPHGLLLVLDGPEGATGAFVIGRQVLAGIVEHQTIGQVLPIPAQDRAPTKVEAALVTPLIEAVLARMSDSVSGHSDSLWAHRFRFGAMVADSRALLLSLGEPRFQVFTLDVQLAGGERTGPVLLAFPDRKLTPPKEDTGSSCDTRVQFQASVCSAPAELMAILTRISVPLTKLQALKVGDVLSIPAGALGETILETAPSKKVAKVTLGQMNGLRAVRFQSGLESSIDAAPPDKPDDKIQPVLPNAPIAVEPQARDIQKDLGAGLPDKTFSKVSGPSPTTSAVDDFSDLDDVLGFEGALGSPPP